MHLLLSGFVQNVLLSLRSSRIRAKLCDFDVSQSLAFSQTLPKKFQVDNPIWSAPEERVSLSSDIYSLSIILWEIVEWRAPFTEIKFMFQISQKVREGYRPEFVSPVNRRARKLIERGWNGNPTLRPSAAAYVHKLKLVEALETVSSPDIQ